MLTAELRHSLKTDEHFIYVEKMLRWVQVNKPQQSVIHFLWSTIKQESLSYDYVTAIRDQLIDDRAFIDRAEIPAVTDLGKYKFTSTTWNSRVFGVRELEGLLDKEHTAELGTELCTVKGCNLGILHVRVLKLQDTTPCYSLNERALVKTLGHTHPNLIKHWYIIKVHRRYTSKSYDSLVQVTTFMSLVTHSLQEVLDAVRPAVQANSEPNSVTVHCLEEQQ